MIKTLNGVRLVRFEPEQHTLIAYHWQNSGEYGEFFRAMPVPASMREIAVALDGKTMMVVANDQVVGAIMHFNQDEIARNFEVAILMDKAAEKKGIGFTALKMFLNWKFNACNLYLAEFNTLERNRRLHDALINFGALYEGTRRKRAFVDRFQNVSNFSIINKEFNDLYQQEFNQGKDTLRGNKNGQESSRTFEAVPGAAVRGAGELTQ